MKTQIKRLSKSTLAVILTICMFVSCLMVGTITANAWGVQSGKTIYFINTGSWSTVKQNFKGNGWSNYEQMYNITGTGIWYRTQSGGDYTTDTDDGFRFASGSSDSSPGNTTSYFKDWVTSNKVYWPNSASDNIASAVNGSATVTTKIDTGSGSYTTTSNSDCVATISSIKYNSGTSTAATSGSTGSSSSASCTPAYGASVSYSATDKGDYEFKGFSTTNSSSLPTNATTSYSARKSTGYNSSGNLSTVYAYFQKKTASKPAPTDFYVVGGTGSSGGVFGTNWGTGTAANRLKLVSGTYGSSGSKYSIEYTKDGSGNNWTAGDYTYKVIDNNGDYYPSGGDGYNCTFKIESYSTKVTIEFTYNGSYTKDTNPKATVEPGYDPSKVIYVVDNAGKGNNLRYYVYKDGQAVSGFSWPGKLMSSDSNVEYDSANSRWIIKNLSEDWNIMFTTGSGTSATWQTKDEPKVQFGKTYTINGDNITVSGGGSSTPTTGKIYVVKQTDDSVNMYVWNDNGDVFDRWPGIWLDDSTDHIKYYDYWDKGYAYTVYDVHDGDKIKFRFNGDSKKESNELTIKCGYTYYVYWDSDGNLCVSESKSTPDWADEGGSTDPKPGPGGDDTVVWPPKAVVDGNYTTTNNYEYVLYGIYEKNGEFYDSPKNTQDFKYNSNSSKIWVDLSGYVEDIKATKSKRIYVALSGSTNSSGINNGSGVVVEYNATDTPGAKANKNEYSSKNFAQVDITDEVIKLGVVITKSTNITYHFYTAVQSSSSGGGDDDDDKVETVNIIAKDGALRGGYSRFAELADTKITSVVTPNKENVTIKHGEKEYYGNKFSDSANFDSAENVPVGSKITIETTLDSNANNSLAFGGKAFSSTHYVRGYSINGMTYEVYSPNSTGKYTMTWTVEAVNVGGTMNGNTIEITPVFYLQNSTYTKTFYIEGYAGDVEKSWGNSLYAYPYYNNTSPDQKNAFGGYPGQPMLFWGGKYQTQIPLTVTGASAGSAFQGITLSNGYWDLLHQKADTACSKGHKQTYDYDDFQKIYQEKNPKTIYYWFKYRTKDNYGDTGESRGTYNFAGTVNSTTLANKLTSFDTVVNRNGSEVLTDYYGRQVNIFGTLLNSGDRTSYKNNGASSTLDSDELFVVSNGYKKTYIGDYSTIWAVYKQTSKGNFTLLGYITPGLLHLKEWDNVKDYDGSSNKGEGDISWDMFKNTYTTLKQSYTKTPVIVAYEGEIENTSGNVAKRSDGQWYYSMGNEKINAYTKIQYAESLTAPDINSTLWTDDPYNKSTAGVGGKYNQGTTTKCNAYFTNTNITGGDKQQAITYMTEALDVLVDNNKNFTFQAQAADGWVFVGWVRQNQLGELSEITSTGGLGSSNVSANDTYIARFIKAETGNLKISHNVRQNEQYAGNGTQYLKVEVLDASKEEEATYESTDGSDIDLSRYINSVKYGTYTIRITLKTKPDKNCHFGYRMCTNPSSKFGFTTNKDASKYTVGTDGNYTDTISFTVNEYISTKATSLRYRTYLTRDKFTYNYEIKYHYESRYYGNQAFTVKGKLTDDDDEFFNVTDSDDATLTVDFIRNQTPYENSFRHTPNWNYSSNTLTVDDPDAKDGKSTAQPMTQSSTLNNTTKTYTIKVHVYAAYEIDDVVHATFRLPYLYNTEDLDHKSATGIKFTDKNGKALSDEVVYVYDDNSFESFDVATRIGHLFEPREDQINMGSEGDKTYQYGLVQAAPYIYVLKDGPGLSYHMSYKSESHSGTYVTSSGQELKPGDSLTLKNGSIVTQQNGSYTIQVATIDGVIKDGCTFVKKYFTRWDIYTTDGDYVSSCFYRDFNYSGLENYIVIPVYERDNEGDPPTAHPRDDNYDSTPDSESDLDRVDDTSASITYLGDTRNQWNEGDSGDAEEMGAHWATQAGDFIYSDFNLAFHYAGREINKIDESEAHISYGLMFEKLGPVKDVDENGSMITDDEYYAQQCGKNWDEQSIKNYIQAKLDNTKAPRPSDDTTAALIKELGGNYGNYESTLTNMNRIRFTNTFIKSCESKDSSYDNKYADYHEEKNVYRVHAYIVVDGEITVSAPIYFTIYGTATL